MIFDTIAQAPRYFSGDWWRDVLAFAARARPDLPVGEQPLRGQDLFVKILDFTTGPPETAVLESHRLYADVHIVLEGREQIRVWPVDALGVRHAYDAERDVVFYEPPPQSAPVTLDLHPGHLAVFEPQDAHMPALASAAPVRVRKLVFKVATRLFTAESR